jgi:hypothetical protein
VLFVLQHPHLLPLQTELYFVYHSNCPLYIFSFPTLIMSNLLKFKCPFASGGCSARFRSQAGRTNHVRTYHTNHNIVNNTEDPSQQSNNSSQACPAPHPDIFPDFDVSFPEDQIAEEWQELPAPDVLHPEAEPQPGPGTASSGPRSTRQRIYHPHLTGMFHLSFKLG